MKKFIGLALLVMIWNVLGRIAIVPLFPPLSSIFSAGYDMLISGILVKNILYSFGNVLAGVLIAVIISFLLSLLFYLFRDVEEMMTVPVDGLRNISALALFPVFLVLFGVGREVQISIIVWASWSNILISTMTAIRLVDKEILEAAMLDGAGRIQLFRHMTFPLATPHVISALRVSLGYGWLSLIASEMIGGTHGLGYLILSHSSAFQFEKMYASILTVTIIGFVMQRMLYSIQKKLQGEIEDERQDSKNLRTRYRAVWNSFLDSLLRPEPTDKHYAQSGFYDHYIP